MSRRLIYFHFFIALSFSEISVTLASQIPIASVAKLRGSVTKLLPGALEASQVNIGDLILEDTSLVTGPKSFIQVKFIDNSLLNMGPESKIVVTSMKKDTPGIISLLKGRIRTEVQKSNESNSSTGKNKFYIRTRSAAMGVRGTDFQTIYNPENNVTSLLTFKGQVAFTKIEEETHLLFEEGTTKVIRDDLTNAVTVSKVSGAPVNEHQELGKILNKNEVVLVPAGQNAFSSQSLSKSSQPVKISTVQFNALYRNNEFQEKNVLNLKSALSDKGVKPIVDTAPQAASIDGFYNKKTGEFAPRAGGFIDLNTALYIAPDQDSKFDKNNNIYLALNSGDVDKDSGEYFPPPGLKLDPKEGFVILNKSDARVELFAKKEDLNNLLAQKIVIGIEEDKNKNLRLALEEKFIRNYLTLNLSAGSHLIELNKKTNRANFEVEDSSSQKLEVQFQSSSKKRFTTLSGFSLAKVDFKKSVQQTDIQDSQTLWSLYVGGKYAWSTNLDFFLKLGLDQKHFAESSSVLPDSFIFKKVVMTKLSMGVDYEFFNYEKWSLLGQLSVSMMPRKKYNSLIVNKGAAYGLNFGPQYQFDKKRSLSLTGFLKNESSEVTSSLAYNEQTRGESGLELKYIFAL